MKNDCFPKIKKLKKKKTVEKQMDNEASTSRILKWTKIIY